MSARKLQASLGSGHLSLVAAKHSWPLSGRYKLQPSFHASLWAGLCRTHATATAFVVELQGRFGMLNTTLLDLGVCLLPATKRKGKQNPTKKHLQWHVEKRYLSKLHSKAPQSQAKVPACAPHCEPPGLSRAVPPCATYTQPQRARPAAGSLPLIPKTPSARWPQRRQTAFA